MGVRVNPVVLWVGYILLFIVVLVGSLQWAGYLGSIGNGVQVGYPVAVLIWLSSIFSLVAALSLALLFILRSRGVSLSSIVSKRKKVLLLFIVIVLAIILGIQFGTSLLTPIERGISEGVAPPALMEISSLVSLFSVLGALILIRQGSGPAELLSTANGGSASPSPVIEANREPTSSEVKFQPAPAVQPQRQTQTQQQTSYAQQEALSTSSSSAQVKVEEDVLKKVSTIISPSDLPLLTSSPPSSSLSQSERDALQTRKNIAEWIILSLNIGGKTPKGKLEMAFEEQFPKVYVPLFNSVLYDLIYQGKVETSKEGNRMMIFLPKQEQKQQ
ncbi:MAG: hypothetical protein QXX17_07485 [Conexivisphaerales archaeon]